MSVDYNELYQEFIQLTSSPSSTSSASSPPPDSSSVTGSIISHSPHPPRFPPLTSETLPPTRKTVLTPLLQRMNNSAIQDPQTPGTTTATTTDHCISSPGGCPVSSSSSNNISSHCGSNNNSLSSSSPVIMNQHAQYGWHQQHNSHHIHQQHQSQQQQQMQIQTAEKRKDLAGSIPVPPNSPSEPPAKKPALQGTDSVDSSSDRNNNNSNSGVVHHHEMHQDLSTDMKFPIVPSCIVNNIRATNQGNALSSMGYPPSEGRNEGEEGTNCVIIQKHPTPAPLNELRRLLSTPAANNQINRHNTSQGYQQTSHINPFMQDYGIEGNGEQLAAAAGWNHQHQQMSDHHQQQEQHASNELQNHGQNGPAIYPQHSPLLPSQEVMDEVVRFMPYYASSNEQPTFPGGLEVLWKEVPEDCQRLITPQDVPETARFRGYFTVCELLTLKRSLMSRLTSVRNGQEPMMRKPPPSASAVAAAAANARADNIINTGMGNTGVGGAVKEALAVLQDDNQPQHHLHHHHQQQQQQQQEQHHPMTTVSICNINHQSSPPSFIQNNNGMDESDVPLDHVNHLGPKDFAVTAPIMRPSNTPPPPYRTSTLVFKLLIIGSYRFRSFSHGNPNRLRVLFNTQRLSYECHLPMVQASNDSTQMLRKVLTIDVGFEQIAHLKFGSDQLQLRVNGPPVLNLSRNPAGPNEMPSTPPLSAEDHDLLDQIEKGSLKLGPVHTVHFINERLVHQLENQFKEHPRLKHFFLHDQGRAVTTGMK